MTEEDELASFARLLAILSKRGDVQSTSLARLGFSSTPAVLEFLASLQIQHVAPLHLDLARKLAADPLYLRRLRGVRLDESLFDLMGAFERVRPLLTRRFFLTYHYLAKNQEPLWWAATHLNRTLQSTSAVAVPINSTRQLLRAGAGVKGGGKPLGKREAQERFLNGIAQAGEREAEPLVREDGSLNLHRPISPDGEG